LLEVGLNEGAETDDDLRRLADFELPRSGQVKLAMKFPPDGLEAIAAIRNSGGHFLYASDSDALAAQKRLGEMEGIYAEVSASVAVVEIEEMLEKSMVRASDTIVGLVCGSGFRETGELARSLAVEEHPIYSKHDPGELAALLVPKNARA
jgi:threonine synthase